MPGEKNAPDGLKFDRKVPVETMVQRASSRRVLVIGGT